MNVLTLTAIGDALGVPFENKSASDSFLKSWNGRSFYNGRYGKGAYSDDTQMSIMVAESLLVNNGFNPQDLSERYIDWYVSGEARGMGRTTFAAIQCLIKGVHWSKSGVEGSYGNGTAMRAAPFGIFYVEDCQSLLRAVEIDSAITHQSIEAETGAKAVALAIYFIVNGIDRKYLIQYLLPFLSESITKEKISQIAGYLNPKITPKTALLTIGTKYKVFETVPTALYTFIKFKKFTQGVATLIRAGGDTDTNAAIAGAFYGAKQGLSGIPKYLHSVENFDYLVHLDNKLSRR